MSKTSPTATGPTVEHLPPLRLKEKYSSAVTNRSNTIVVRKATVSILEMEDVLFHLDSAVMMPESPTGASSSQGGAGAASSTPAATVKTQQESLTGLKALAVAFKQIEFDPSRKVIIAAHADTSGKADYNFKLAKNRGEGVYCLLTGGETRKQRWMTLCAEQHRIEDYQQIMCFVQSEYSWGCGLSACNNTWDGDTERATEAFLRGAGLAGLLHGDPDALVKTIKNDPAHKWPTEAWEVVYEIYQNALAQVLGWTASRSANRKVLESHQAAFRRSFLHPNYPYVACGEAFPIDAAQKPNYRSQQNRRVEILFFDQKDLHPDSLMQCSKKDGHVAGSSSVAVAYKKRCPIWPFKNYLLPLYIDREDLYAVVFHLRFVYFDRVKQEICDVPEGLVLKAFDGGGNELPSETFFDNATYLVKVKFGAPVVMGPGNRIFFTFETIDAWVYTANADPATRPAWATATPGHVAGLPLAEKWKHYDLPRRWTSEQWWTRINCTDKDVEQGVDTGGPFDEIVRTTLALKPFGTNVTNANQPLVFCLDDVVLTDDAYAPIAERHGAGAILGANLEVLDPDASNSMEYYSVGGIAGRRIPIRGKLIKGVLFEQRLYAVFQDRVPTGELAGHRAAVLNHTTKCTLVRNFQQRHYRDYHNIGRFDAYLLREMDFRDGREISFVFNYFRWHCEDASTHAPFDPAWINTTLKNITSAWNDDGNGELPKLHFEKDPATTYDILLRSYAESVSKPDQHTIILVYPKGSKLERSYMGRDEGGLREERNLYLSVHAHEFGHAMSLDDDYHEKWKNCCYRHMGFPDHKPGAPFDNDQDAMMNGNKWLRSRYYWHFAVWMNKEFRVGEKMDFSVVRKNVDVFSLPLDGTDTGDPRDTARESRCYFNYPERVLRPTCNMKTGKGHFDLYLYPLGKDEYSQGGLRPGLNCTGVVVLAVNMYFRFWDSLFDSAGYEDIVKTLDAIQRSIEENIIKKTGIKLCGDGPYQETFILIQPRFLVENYTREYEGLNEDLKTRADYASKVTDIKGRPEGKAHFTISVSNPVFGTKYTNTDWSKTEPNSLELVNADAPKFWGYFCQMLGLNFRQLPTKDNFVLEPVVSHGVISNC